MYGCLMLIISGLLGGALGSGSGDSVFYTAGQIESVPHSTAFMCRVRDYAWPTTVRFSVQVRAIGEVADPNAAVAARRFLFERLSNARQVKLGNVQDHGYFRLTADVLVDGRDIAAEMVEYGLAEAIVRTVQESPSEAVQHVRGGLRGFEVPAGVAATPRERPVALRDDALRERLGRVADLSAIGPDTTFEEALRILAEAVEPRLPLLIMWNDLERNAFIMRDMPIGIDGFGRMRVDRGLSLILRAVAASDSPLIAAAEGGVLTIGTRYAGLSKPRTEVYSAGDILAAPSEDRFEQGVGSGGSGMR